MNVAELESKVAEAFRSLYADADRQSNEIEAMQSEIDALHSRVADLEARLADLE